MSSPRLTNGTIAAVLAQWTRGSSDSLYNILSALIRFPASADALTDFLERVVSYLLRFVVFNLTTASCNCF